MNANVAINPAPSLRCGARRAHEADAAVDGEDCVYHVVLHIADHEVVVDRVTSCSSPRSDAGRCLPRTTVLQPRGCEANIDTMTASDYDYRGLVASTWDLWRDDTANW